MPAMSGTISMVVYLGFFFALMYFLIVRPQKKRQKQMSDLRNNIKSGDSVVTIGGIVGKVISVKEDDVVLDVHKNKMTFKKWAISTIEKESEAKEEKTVDPAEVE